MPKTGFKDLPANARAHILAYAGMAEQDRVNMKRAATSMISNGTWELQNMGPQWKSIARSKIARGEKQLKIYNWLWEDVTEKDING